MNSLHEFGIIVCHRSRRSRSSQRCFVPPRIGTQRLVMRLGSLHWCLYLPLRGSPASCRNLHGGPC